MKTTHKIFFVGTMICAFGLQTACNSRVDSTADTIIDSSAIKDSCARLQSTAAKEMFFAEQYFNSGNDYNIPADLQKALNGDGEHQGFLDVIENYDCTKAANTAKYYVGTAYLRLGNYDEAIKYLEAYKPENNTTHSLTLMLLGDAYMEKGNNQKALDLYVKAAETNPDDVISPAALFKAGMCCLSTNDKSGALDYFNTIKEKYPYSAEGNSIDAFIDIARGI